MLNFWRDASDFNRWLKRADGSNGYRQGNCSPNDLVAAGRPEFEKVMPMKSGLVYLRPWRLAYVRQVGPYETTIPAAWDLMLGWLEKKGFTSPMGRGFGLMRDCAKVVGPQKCRYDACVDLDPLFEERAVRELGVLTLPGGSYLRTRTVGSYDDLRKSLSMLHDTFEAPSGLYLDERRPLVTIYLDDPRQFSANDLRSDVCVPVNVRMGRQDASGQEAA